VSDARRFRGELDTNLAKYVARDPDSQEEGKVAESFVPINNTLMDDAAETTGEAKAYYSLLGIFGLLRIWKVEGTELLTEDATTPEQNVLLPFRIKKLPSQAQQNDKKVLALADNEMLAFLSDLQYRLGYALNFWHPKMRDFTKDLFDPASKRHLSDELIQYIDTFGNPDDGIPLFILLQEPRAKMIAEKIASLPERPFKRS
jgi:hypothetical protein